MSSELDTAEGKYKQKIAEDDDLDIDAVNLIDLANGGTVYKSIPVKENPVISYSYGFGSGGGNGSGGGPGGQGNGQVTYGITKQYIIDKMKKWGLLFTKPGKKTGTKLEYMIGKRGFDENQEETMRSMLERQLLSGEYQKYGFRPDVKEEDIRYNIAKDTVIPDKSAYFVIVKDTSGSMMGKGDIANIASLYITIWLEESYKNQVHRVYIAHTNGAKEVGEQNFFSLSENGGTFFKPALDIIHSMVMGVAYPTDLNFFKSIDLRENDLYVLQISDGDNFEGENTELFRRLDGIIADSTKFMYLNIGYSTGSSLNDMSRMSSYVQYINSKKSDKVRLANVGADATKDDIEAAITALLEG
jgi:uncharacterized sporulation protein YeaH/YhbH (DUF444 family)